MVLGSPFVYRSVLIVTQVGKLFCFVCAVSQDPEFPAGFCSRCAVSGSAARVGAMYRMISCSTRGFHRQIPLFGGFFTKRPAKRAPLVAIGEPEIGPRLRLRDKRAFAWG